MNIQKFLEVESLDVKVSNTSNMLRSYALTINNHIFTEAADLLDELYGLAWVEQSESEVNETPSKVITEVLGTIAQLNHTLTEEKELTDENHNTNNIIELLINEIQELSEINGWD